MKLQKNTKRHGKWYDDACGTAFALELLGERWSLLIVRELMLGARRFSDLRASLPGISAKVLTERLEGLMAADIVQRRKLAPPSSAQVYELTAWGYQAEEAIKSLGRWAAASPQHDATLPLSAVSLILSLRTMFDPELAEGVELCGELSVADEAFQVEIAGARLRAERGKCADPDFSISAPGASPIAIAVHGKVDFAELAGMGLAVTGDEGAARWFVACFRMPDKAG
jgi:DNA-binding HxlR family transcriptional regulator